MKRKRILFSLILTSIILPIFVNAKERCTVVTDTGKNIGDEIQCGTETFYVVRSNDTEVQMLAKYSLLVGDKIDYFDVEGDITVYTTDEWSYFGSYAHDAVEACMDYATQKGYNPYYVHAIMNDPINPNDTIPNATLKGCRVYGKLPEDHVKQDERAIGTKLIDGKSVLPLYGITYM